MFASPWTTWWTSEANEWTPNAGDLLRFEMQWFRFPSPGPAGSFSISTKSDLIQLSTEPELKNACGRRIQWLGSLRTDSSTCSSKVSQGCLFPPLAARHLDPVNKSPGGSQDFVLAFNAFLQSVRWWLEPLRHWRFFGPSPIRCSSQMYERQWLFCLKTSSCTSSCTSDN